MWVPQGYAIQGDGGTTPSDPLPPKDTSDLPKFAWVTLVPFENFEIWRSERLPKKEADKVKKTISKMIMTSKMKTTSKMKMTSKMKTISKRKTT